MAVMTATVFRSCTICEATCGVSIRVENGAVADMRGDADDPFSKGRVCPKMVGMTAVQEDSDRLRRPLLRQDGRFVEIGWDEAFERAAAGLREVRARHGSDAVALYRGNPTIHDAGTLLGARAVAAALGTRQLYSAGALDTWPRFVQCTEMYGGPTRIPVPDVDRTDYFLIVGANPVVSQGSIMTAPGIAERLRAIRGRGGRVVVVDPRRTETAALADEHVAVVPGSDAALLLAMIHVLFAENLVRLGRLNGLVAGLERIRELAQAFPPERAADACGVPAELIRRLAREFASARSAVAYGRMGTSVQAFGTLASWGLDLLCILTGNLDRPGGAMFTMPAVNLNFGFEAGGRVELGRWRSRVSEREEMFGEFPITALAEEIETPGDGQVHALVTIAGNPVNTAPNSRRLERAVGSLEFMVSLDYYVNETTRYADVIIPPPGPLERSHYDVLLMHVAVRNIAKWSPAALPAPAETPDGWTASMELARRLAAETPIPFGPFEEAIVRKTAEAALAASRWRDRLEVDELLEAGREHSGVARVVDALLRLGDHGDACGRVPDGLNLKRVQAAPHGLDLGALEPRLPEIVRTPSGKIELAPPRIVNDLMRLEAWLRRPANGALKLINRRDPRSMNSWLHNAAPLAKGPLRCTLLMHPDDAQCRQIRNGDLARLVGRTGEIDVPVEVTDCIRKGVVSLPHGFGHDGEGLRLTVASRRPGRNVNDVSDDLSFDAPSGASALFGVPVEVVPVAVPPQVAGT